MPITEIPNANLTIKNTNFALDKPFPNTMADPLPQCNFVFSLIGAPKSGKTHLLMSLLTNKPKNKKAQSYKKVFKNVIFVSPSAHNIKDKNLEKIKYKFDHVDLDILNQIETIAIENKEDGEQTLVIFDDVSTQLKHKTNLLKISQMCKNHRQFDLSMFILSQKFNDLPTAVRNCSRYFAIFTLDNGYEKKSIMDELPLKGDQFEEVYNHIFNDDSSSRHNFLLIDMSRSKMNKVRYFKNFNELNIT